MALSSIKSRQVKYFKWYLGKYFLTFYWEIYKKYFLNLQQYNWSATKIYQQLKLR